MPEFPASSPYVTAVGGTEAAPGFPLYGAEKAVFLSSGGFSNRYEMPKYQRRAVDEYLKSASSLPSPSVGYDARGRAYPDISAQAAYFCVTPFTCGIFGTSCASPTAAGVFALVNDARLARGKRPLGFLNPLIYKRPWAFHDITMGESTGGCGATDSTGWPTAVGWDAATGIGTPNYERLARL